MQIVIKIDEARFKDIQRIAEVQLNRRTDTVEQLIANGTPLEQTGKWEFVCQHWSKCSECGFSHKFAEDWNYCPDCGARMIDAKESEGGMSQEVKEHYEKLGAYYNTKGENK